MTQVKFSLITYCPRFVRQIHAAISQQLTMDTLTGFGSSPRKSTVCRITVWSGFGNCYLLLHISCMS